MKFLAIVGFGVALAVSMFLVGFSPGLSILFASIVLITVPMLASAHSPFTPLNFFSPTADLLTGHGHVHLRASSLGACGRHGPPHTSTMFVVLAVWVLIIGICRRAQDAVAKFSTTAGHVMARTNMSAQPLPS